MTPYDAARKETGNRTAKSFKASEKYWRERFKKEQAAKKSKKQRPEKRHSH